MENYSKVKTCFILGIDQRSGTNHMYNVLEKHPACFAPGPIWEDHFLQNASLIDDYVKAMYRCWDSNWSNWNVEDRVGPQATLFRYFGEAIEKFLTLQLNGCEKYNAERDNHQEKILLTKTPTVDGLDNFFKLFPESYLIIIVRDGRSVVESGVRSFDWNYEDAMFRWRDNANKIFDFMDKAKGKESKYLVVKYEDMVLKEEAELERIFSFLGLSFEEFNLQETQAAEVIGSSSTREETGSIHWKKEKRKDDFKPLERFKDWSKKRHERFNWIAGYQMKRFGYPLVFDNSKGAAQRLNHTFFLVRRKAKKVLQTWFRFS